MSYGGENVQVLGPVIGIVAVALLVWYIYLLLKGDEK